MTPDEMIREGFALAIAAGSTIGLFFVAISLMYGRK